MEILSERMKVLLDHLIKNKEVSSEVLAVYANVTPRTIKSDIQKMQSILKPYGSEIISRRGHGYRLQINDETAFAVLRTFLKNNNENEMLDVPKTRFERVAYLMRKLLMIDYPIKIEELADEVFVSRQMLSADIKELRRLLYNYELEIVSNNEGIMISGNEILKRRCINDAFFQKNNQDFFVQNHTMFSSEMNQKEIRFIREALLNVLNKHSIRFSDFSVQNMVIHIMISIRRYQFYQYVSISNEKEIIIKNGPYYEVAFDLAKKIENNFSVEFPQDEIVYLAMHIQSKSIIGNENVVKENTDVDELLYHIYKRIKVRFNISFFLNHELNEFLKLHIPSMVERIRNKLYMRNPLLYETMRHYQFAVEICMEAVDEIESWYDIKLDENEFAYLVLYFNLALSKLNIREKRRIILVCGHGRPEMILMLNELNEKFSSQIRGIETLDIYELNTFKFQEDDVLIATIPVSNYVDIPFIYIRDHMERYYEEIYSALSSTKKEHFDIKTYFNSNRIIENLECESQEEVLFSLKNMLTSEIGLYQAELLIDNIRTDFAEVGKEIVIMHSLKDCPIPFFGVITLKVPILWNRNYVSCIVFCSCTICGRNIMEELFTMLSQWSDRHIKVKGYEKLCSLLQPNR